jgi:D-3-phosphoglycerate dehydrogenase
VAKKCRLLILESIHPAGVKRLQEFAHVRVLLNVPREQVLAAMEDIEVVVCKSVTRVDREFLAAAPQLKVVGRAGTGTDNFDKAALVERGIPLLTVPTGNSVSAAEFGLMCILMLAKRAVEAIDAVRAGDFRRDLLEGRELSRMTVGLLGVGNVGRLVASRLQAFGCKVLGYDPEPHSTELARSIGVKTVDSTEVLLASSDLVSLHATINERSRGIINRATLAAARPGLLLVNIARGGLMVDADVIAALDDGRLAALAIDTLAPEPPYNAAPGSHSFDHPLLHHPKVVVFPHMAASTTDAQESIAVSLAEQIAVRVTAPTGQGGKA